MTSITKKKNLSKTANLGNVHLEVYARDHDWLSKHMGENVFPCRD